MIKTHLYRVSKKIGISDLMYVGWLSAIQTGNMITFWNPWDQTSALGVIISFMIILRMIRKVSSWLLCDLGVFCHLHSMDINSAIFSDSKLTDLFGKEITLATTLLTDFFKITASLMAKMDKNCWQCDQYSKK